MRKQVSKRAMKIISGVCMALALCIGMAGSVQAAQTTASNINVTLGTTDNARSGSNVSARIVLDDNPGITTFAMKLAYDSNYLTYTGATWANAVSSNSNNVQLISEVTENGGPVLNISSILSSTYSNDETIVTLNFTVKQDYTTMPVTLTNREITNSSYGTVTPAIVVDASAGANSGGNNNNDSQSQSNSNDDSQSQSNNNNNNNNNNSQSQNSGDNKNSQNSSSNSGNNNSGDKNDKTDKNKDKTNLDKTPKTGAYDMTLLLAGAIVVFLVVAGICIRVLGKKRQR